MHRLLTRAGLFLLAALPLTAQQQPLVVTFAEALERARSAPAVVAARMQTDEARERLAGAALSFPSNPGLEIQAGRRSGDSSSTDFAFEASQDLELPAVRRNRLDVGRAAVIAQEQVARDVERHALHAAAVAFVRTLEARERAATVTAGRELAVEALHIAERRYAAGDVAQLDVNLARTAVARADAEVLSAAAAITTHSTQLQLLLGMNAPVTAGGSLRDPIATPVDDLSRTAADRADVRRLDAEIAAAEAEHRIARTLRWPELGLRASYEREEGDRIVMGGVGLSVPVFQRGLEATAVAKARLGRLRAEREALVRAIEIEVRGATASHEALRAAAALYETTVLPLVEENEKLALESYEAGQIGLAELLVVRRESLDARRSLIDQLTGTRLAEIELRTHTGVWK